MEDRALPTVVLGVTGSIAAYKACEVARELMRRGVRVKVVMTASAKRFVSPLTFGTLTGEPVITSLWEESPERVRHIALAEEADAVVVAPCTANVIAKVAQGRADDVLTAVLLATAAPVVIAPAMNTGMWRNEITQRNLAELRRRGFSIVEPGIGPLASGEKAGEGRLAALGDIFDAVMRAVSCARSLEGVRLLVTAGPTREPIDAVRFIGNRSSGKQGYAIAEEAARRGAEVTLVSGPTSLPDPPKVRMVRVETAEQMRDAVEAAYGDSDAVVMTAAVADFRPAEAAGGKIKKGAAPDSLPLERTADILAGLGERKGDRVLVGFAAETEDLIGYAQGKLAEKNLDLVVANDVSRPGVGFDSDVNRVVLVSAEGEEPLPLLDKRDVAAAVLDRLAELLPKR